MLVHWDTDAGAPCCAGRIVADDGRDVLVQTDWDHPGVASTFGWSVRDVQRCRQCGGAPDDTFDCVIYCADCDRHTVICEHTGTDGTVDCPDCGIGASEFIRAAGEYLDSADGASADDPGYFAEGGAE